MSGDPRPVLFVTNHAPAFRIGAFAALHAPRTSCSRSSAAACATAARSTAEPLPFPVAAPAASAASARLAASGRFRAVVAGLSGRVALPAAYAGARAARVPFVLWATIWRHPRTAAHALSYLPLRHLYRHADAIATYGPHVSAYVRAKGARGPVVEAPQSVDDAFWTAPADAAAPRAVPGRCSPAGWRRRRASRAAARLAGRGSAPERRWCWSATVRCAPGPSPPARSRRRCAPGEVRNFYAGSDVVVVPSVPTRDFLEPWGLVVNEAFDQGVPVIATTAVGRRRRRARPPRGDRARRARRRRGRAGAPRCGACATTPRCARGSAPRAARRSPRATRTRDWAAGMRRALAAAGAGRAPRRAASVARAMPRLLLVMVLTLLVAAPAAMAGTRADIIGDCYDDGKLDGNYTPSEIRDARNNLPADIDQYSDCRDVLARALGGSGDKQVGGGGGGGNALGGGGGGGAGGGSGRAADPERPRGAGGARQGGGRAAATRRSRSATARSCPGAADGRPQRPAPDRLLAALILLGLAALAGAVPSVRRRVLARRLA